MTDVNKLIIHGRIVRNAEFTTTDSGLTIARFALASNRARRNQNKEWVNETTFVPLTLFGERAVALGPYLKKGRGISVEGHLRQYHWEKDGEKRSELGVVVDNVLFDPVLKKSEEVQSVAAEALSPQPVQVQTVPVQKQEPQSEGIPFPEDLNFYSDAELDFPPPEVMESFEIF